MGVPHPIAPHQIRTLLPGTSRLARLTSVVGLICAIRLSGTSGALMAEDTVLDDWRLQGGLSSASYDAPAPQITTGAGASAYHPAFARNAQSNHRVEVHYQRGALGTWGGPVYGISAWYDQAKFVDQDHEDDLNAAGLDLDVGYGIALLSGWHLEATVQAGGGRSQTEVIGTSDQERTRPDYEYGARIAAYWTGASGFQLGLIVPYLVNDTHPTYAYVGTDGNLEHVDETRINRGFGLLVECGLRW